MNFPVRASFIVPIAHGGRLVLGERPLVMGILNLSPDSFAERVRVDAVSVLDTALRMQEEGADLLDIGGESTRPGAEAVTAEEELRRVLPALAALAGRVRVPLSIDTQKAAVARAAVAEGAAIVNDVSALADAGLAAAAAEAGAGLVLTHNRGQSSQMYARATYADVVAEVTAELRHLVSRALAGGMPEEGVILDPGVGFAKRPEHSYGVLAGVPEIAVLGRPLLIGPSRKSFLAAALDNRPAVERDWGTAAAVAASVLAGAHIVRVHAVETMVQVVRVAEEIRRAASS